MNSQTAVQNNNMVQMSLFSRGDAIRTDFINGIRVKDSVRKKDKKVVKDANGNPIITGHTVRMLPAKSESGPSLESISGKTGTELALFKQELGQAMLRTGFSHMAALVSTGNFVFDMARASKGGKFVLGIKLAPGKVPVLNIEELEKQAKQMGFVLIRPETKPETKPEQPQAPTQPAQPELPSNGEAHVIPVENRKPRTLPKRKNATTPMVTK